MKDLKVSNERAAGLRRIHATSQAVNDLLDDREKLLARIREMEGVIQGYAVKIALDDPKAAGCGND